MKLRLQPERKHRLYICFKEITTRPGVFHWAILLSPTPEQTNLEGSFIFHVTNIPDAEHPGAQGLLWRYEKRPAIPEWIPKLTARALVAKFPADKSISDWANIIDLIISRVELVQSDPNWRCGTWAKYALQALEREGREYDAFKRIPQISPALEAELREFAADEAKKSCEGTHGSQSSATNGGNGPKNVRKDLKKLPLKDIRRDQI
jgi:hypothetical protein